MRKERINRGYLVFLISFITILIIFALGVVKTYTYNATIHHEVFQGTDLFTQGKKSGPVTVYAEPRTGTWTKVYDLNREGITIDNVQAYTYDFFINNNTKDEVEDFKFTLAFHQEVFLASAWNGALEIHQQVTGGEMVATIPDLRQYNPQDYALDIVSFEGDHVVHMKPDDYLVYYPSSSANAMEIPVEPYEGVTPGMILYMGIRENIGNAEVDLEYKFHRVWTNEPLFWISFGCLAVWSIALIISVITSMQIKKYKERHERDNELIKESIETFTGFIDAKDPYTNGHSARVAEYTRRIAEEMGYSGEELDRIYYVALLHDCGKIGVPDNILGKPGRLTDEEFEIIKSHTVRGGEILSSFTSLKNVGEGALYHHERYDGKGYPEGRKGKEIPLIARMICVADSFDAMNSNRVYRKKLTMELIIEEIEKNKGKQFDPEIADVMLRLLREGKMELGEDI